MKRKNEKVPGLDEIVFENRNKEYGAYDIRKHYLPSLSYSLLGGTAFFILLVLLFSFSSRGDVKAVDSKEIVIVIETDSTIRALEKIIPPDPELPKPETRSFRYLPPEVVDTLLETDITLAPVGLLDSVINKPVDEVIEPVEEPDPVVTVEPEPVVWVEEMPEFPGGEAALLRFINENVKYPEEAVENNLEGRVVVRFVVSADGTVKRAELLKGVHPVLDSEALRVVSLMPKWRPGKQNGTSVPVWFSVPVKFELKRY
ncbi:MAG TPA: energy transducer TonB [Bacteroidales bacterium]|nr:energy transducer TonB [Bacteroidales bacterium]HRT89718.1 energy transducer TonB [Bacteroidales bacterium]